jgi:hypothetical protein
MPYGGDWAGLDDRRRLLAFDCCQSTLRARATGMDAATGGLDQSSAVKSKMPVPGDVLIAGGASGTKSKAKAQFYDPNTTNFSTTRALANSRIAPVGLAWRIRPEPNRSSLAAPKVRRRRRAK